MLRSGQLFATQQPVDFRTTCYHSYRRPRTSEAKFRQCCKAKQVPMPELRRQGSLLPAYKKINWLLTTHVETLRIAAEDSGGAARRRALARARCFHRLAKAATTCNYLPVEVGRVASGWGCAKWPARCHPSPLVPRDPPEGGCSCLIHFANRHSSFLNPQSSIAIKRAATKFPRRTFRGRVCILVTASARHGVASRSQNSICPSDKKTADPYGGVGC
jgi:hypothetical protein